MAEKILMLALSPTMETGIISKWLKQEGDAVASGDVICEVETDKATMDYESSAVGVLLKIVLPAGASASVGDLIAVIGKSGEDISQLLAAPAGSGGGDAGKAGSNAKPASAEPAAPTAPTASAEPATVESPESAAPEQPGSDQPSQVTADSQETGQAVASGFVRSSPLARKIAQIGRAHV